MWTGMLAAAGVMMMAGQMTRAAEPAQQPLWPGVAPGSEKWINAEKVAEHGIISGHFQPTIAVYPAPKDKATGVGVVVCPGGGYWVVAYDHEGQQIAKMLNDLGVSVVLLKYRVMIAEKEPGVHERALADATRAVQYMRTHAAELHVDPQQIGILGFSAGGHLALNVALHPQAAQPAATDPLERVSSAVAFQVLIYPATKGLNEQITSKTPPAFMAVANDDGLSTHSVRTYQAMYDENVTTELHIFAYGGHGFGLGHPGTPDTQWAGLLATWLKNQTWVTHPTTRPAPATQAKK